MPLLGTLLVVTFWLHYQQPAGFTFKFRVAKLWAFLRDNKDKRCLLSIVLLFEIYLFSVFMPQALWGERILGAWPAVDLSRKNLVNKESGGTFWVNLRGARLQGADLTGANLEKADLRQANLEGAKLVEANLRGADLTGANIRGADLTDAILDSADLDDLKWKLSDLRTIPDTSLHFVTPMLVEKGFFDKNINPSANGFPNRFELQKEGTVVFDQVSGLMWRQSGSEKFDFNQALAYIDTLNERRFAGFNDWRLPTLEESASLMEPNMQNGNLHIDPVFNSKQAIIWTADRDSPSSGWVVSFGNGVCRSSHVDNEYYVRAVR